MKYGVKMIIKHTVETGEVFLEESILLLDAESFDDGYQKAVLYVMENDVCSSYRNLKGHTVHKEIVSFADCFSVYDDDAVIEVYSSIHKPRPELPEETLLCALTESCSKEELFPLRQIPG